MGYRNPFYFLNRGRGGMLNMLRMLGAMGSMLGSSLFGMGMGGAVATSRKGVKDSGEMPFTAEEYAKRKKRQKMARESRRRNRKNRKAS